MSYSEPSHDAEPVATRLTRAWRFLSGEQRSFELFASERALLDFTQYSFFMPIKCRVGGKTGGVGVLMQRADALMVASHMFGVTPAAVPQADLHDACAEVCNVFSDALAALIVGVVNAPMGLPIQVNAEQYTDIINTNVIQAIYRGCADGESLYVVVYYLSSQPV